MVDMHQPPGRLADVTIPYEAAFTARIELRAAQREWMRRAVASRTAEQANAHARWAAAAGVAYHELERAVERALRETKP